ncbi:MAG TPA: hypothetical protein VHN16_04075 [Streptosporangiaceae bacterium]|nr:hypothetical protein [Streptosporangiaceae bacterium]
MEPRHRYAWTAGCPDARFDQNARSRCPRPLEAVLVRHPDVTDAAVIGLPG